MNEKKLTDEQSDLLIEFDEYGFAPTITMPNAEEYAIAWKKRLLDLIHRLQDENKTLKRNYKSLQKSCQNLGFVNEKVMEENAKQKAEIERLTEERENIRLFQLSLQNGEIDMTIESPMAKSFYDCIVQIFEQNGAKNFFTTTLELESQSGKYAFTIEKVGGITAAERIAKLQKQVDGLKLDLENWKKAAYGYKYAEEQAVKDTAKEILQEGISKCKELENKYSHLCKSKKECLMETCRYEGVLAVKRELYELAKQKGVEVE